MRQRILVALTVLAAIWGLANSQGLAQDTGNQGGGQGGFDFGNQSDFGNVFGGNTGDGGSGDFSIGDDPFGLQRDVEITENVRFENGFVGVTTGDLDGEGSEQSVGFVGQRSGEDFGGGINNSLTLGSSGNTGAGARAGNQAGGFVGGGTSLYFEVQRRGIRARLRPAFAFVPRIDNRLAATQFVSRLDRLPATQEMEKSFSIQISNRTAVITGTVGSVAERDQIERQLRLEPGIYRINNQLQVRQ